MKTRKTISKDVLEYPKEKQLTVLNHRFTKLYNNSKFQALDSERQDAIKSQLYDRYVVPVMKNHGMIPPRKEDWLQSKKRGVLVPESAGQQHKDAVNIFGVSSAEALTKVDLFGAKALHTAALFEGNMPFLKYFAPVHEAESQFLKKSGEKVLDRINQWKGDHYTEILSHRVASKSGEIMGQLPVYQAIGGVFSGAKLSGQVLGRTPAGKFVAQSLVNAADGFLTTVATGADKKEGVNSAVTFVGMGTLGAATKPFLAKLLSLGGRKLVAETMAKTAEEEAKVADPILAKLNQVGQVILNSISREKLGKVFTVLSDKEKAEVGKEVAQLTNEAEKEVTVHGKDVLEQLVSEDLAKTPSLKDIDPKTVVKQITDKAKVETGMVDPLSAASVLGKTQPFESKLLHMSQAELTKHFGRPVLISDLKPNAIWDSGHGEVILYRKPSKFERAQAIGKPYLKHKAFQEGLEKLAALQKNKQGHSLPINQAEKIVPGAANPNSLEFAINAANKYSPKIMMHLEGVKNKLLFAYSISNQKDKQIILRHLKDEFPKESAKQINDRVKTLYQHIQEMGLTGYLPPEDERGVFRSTRTAGDPSKWQKELKDEVVRVNGKLKNYPTAQQALKAINKLIGEN